MQTREGWRAQTTGVPRGIWYAPDCMRLARIAAAFAACVAIGCGDDTAGDSSGTSGGANVDGSSGIGGSGSTGATSTGTTGDALDSGSDGSDGSDSSGGMSSVCDVVGVVGECGDVSTCPSGFTAFQGICGGEPSNQCCVPTSPPCSRLGAPGLCMPESLCPAPFDKSDGFCPDTELYQCCTDPLTQCGPTQMPLPNEGLVEEAWDESCPLGMVLVSNDFGPISEPYCIDRYEASLELLDEDGELLSTWSPYHYPGGARVRAVSVRGAIPQGYISQILADKACMEAGKRLCSGGEWSVGCSGPDFFVFPYGDGWMPEACNELRFVPPQVEYFGTSESWVNDELGHPCLSQLPDTLDVTGENEECVGVWGTVDMMGNLLEWTSDVSGRLRGGSYIDAMNEGPGCYYEAVGFGPQYWDFRTGFRCCADPLE